MRRYIEMGLTCLVCASGCYQAHERTTEPPPPPVDTECVETVIIEGRTITEEKVDLLLMVDDSNSMTEEQRSLAAALPVLFRAIASGDVDLDGEPDFAPVGSINLGVVTSDMGTGGFPVPTCSDSSFGDDGLLRTAGSGSFPDCEGSFPAFLSFDPRSESTTDEFAHDAACLAVTGTGGCGFEQPLEAVLKAVTPAEADTEFFMGTRGHGSTDHAGFIRDDSILVVLLVTDEDDCSAAAGELYNPMSSVYSGDLNLRCFDFPEALHPVERYVDGLTALRPHLTQRLVFGTISGIPRDLSGRDETLILRDPRMDEHIDPSMPTRLAPSCSVEGRGFATPPRRLLEVGAGIREAGGRTVHMSICDDDYTPAVRTILEEIGVVARPVCEDRPGSEG
jgi:hypothetical protein